jgi:multiple sugar transport system substrate-binding protein/putative spermidine/putrescine transport system substrate-binding protein
MGLILKEGYIVRRNRLWIIALLLCLFIIPVSPALAVSPVGSSHFNVKSRVDLSKLTRENFSGMLAPEARTQGTLVFYDFADTLCELLAKEAAVFTQQTGIGVKHVCVDGDTATQQLIAEAQAGKTASADLFFGPNNNMRPLTKAGVIANIPLVDLLPNAADVDQAAGRTSRGFKHGGTVVPFHRNQTALAYNSAMVSNPPQTFEELLAFAKEHSGKVAVTDPTHGGSGSGFLETALLKFSPDCKNDYYNFDLTKDQAEAAAGKCMAPVLNYWRMLKPFVKFTSSNENSIKALANNVSLVSTVWEDDLYTLANKGLVPKTARPTLMKTGQVGDGDGLFVVASTEKAEAALLFANFLMSERVQIDKMEQTGSRTARVSLITKGKIPANLAQYLVPDAIYHERTRPRINGQITNAAGDMFVKEIIAK